MQFCKSGAVQWDKLSFCMQRIYEQKGQPFEHKVIVIQLPGGGGLDKHVSRALKQYVGWNERI